jgi:hypothetical protein
MESVSPDAYGTVIAQTYAAGSWTATFTETVQAGDENRTTQIVVSHNATQNRTVAATVVSDRVVEYYANHSTGTVYARTVTNESSTVEERERLSQPIRQIVSGELAVSALRTGDFQPVNLTSGEPTFLQLGANTASEQLDLDVLDYAGTAFLTTEGRPALLGYRFSYRGQNGLVQETVRLSYEGYQNTTVDVPAWVGNSNQSGQST